MKKDKKEVDYSKGMAPDFCKNCVHYRDHYCEKVKGRIDPFYWCKLFKPKGRRL